MVLKGIRYIVFPLLSFTCLVSVGFAAWAFTEDIPASSTITGNVNVTSANTNGELGKIEIKTGDDYTSESQYYTLVFSEDMTLDETVGVNLYPDIDFIFSQFYEQDPGYAYYLSYTAEYASGSIYYKYVQIADAITTQSATMTRIGTSTSGGYIGSWTGVVNGFSDSTLTIGALSSTSTTWTHSFNLTFGSTTYSGHFSNISTSTTTSDVTTEEYISNGSTYYTQTISLNSDNFDTATTGAGLTEMEIVYDSIDDSISLTFTDGTDGTYQTSTKIMLDLSNKTAMEDYPERYTSEQTFTPEFEWKYGTKPTTQTAYNTFLQEIEDAANETFTIVLTITYEPIPSTT